MDRIVELVEWALQSDEVPRIWALLGPIVAVISAWWWDLHYRLAPWFHKYFEQPRESAVNVANAARAFHGFGKRLLTPLQTASARIPIARNRMPEIMREVRSEVPYQHIHIQGGRNEGKTTLLALIAVAIQPDDEMLVAYHREEDGNSQSEWRGLDASQLLAYWRRSRIRLPRWFSLHREAHLLVLLDEVVPVGGIHPTSDSRGRFLQQLEDAASAEHRIRVLTASNHPLPQKVYAIELTLEDREEKLLVEHLWEAKLISEDLSYSELIDQIQGRRAYKASLKTFLVLLFQTAANQGTHVSRVDDLKDLVKDADTRRALIVVAACQMLDLEISTSLISVLQDITSDRLIEATRAWVTFGTHAAVAVNQRDAAVTERGAALTAPGLAVLFLKSVQLDDAKALNEIYRGIFSDVLKEPDTEVSREFLRHILYRLARRPIQPLEESGPGIAIALFDEFKEPLMQRIDSSGQVTDIAAWFSTLVRLKRPESWQLKTRAFSALTRGQAATGAVITQLAFGCDRLKARLTPEEFKLLDVERFLRKDSADRETDKRRQNEVLTAYCGLLVKAGRRSEALDLFERANEWMPLDALSLVLWAKTQASASPAEALPRFEFAFESAKRNVADKPWVVARVGNDFGEFCEHHRAETHPRKPEDYFAFAQRHARSAPKERKRAASGLRRARNRTVSE